MKEQRGGFSGGIGFVLAAAGSAVGLGNLWRFPYLAAKYGGGIFIFVYLILAFTFGFTLMITEIAIGRKTGKSPVFAYGIINPKFEFLSIPALLVPILMLPGYCVIGGWVIKYMTSYVVYSEKHLQNSYFESFTTDSVQSSCFFAAFLIITILIVAGGVEDGIEKMSRILMPLFIIIILGITIYVITIPGAKYGVRYYLYPDFSKFTIKTLCAAMGQMFYSMSIAMGVMITYGSYMNKRTNMLKSVKQIEIFDAIVALLAGMMVIPSVFILSGENGLSESGPGLMFVALPQVFDNMRAGRIIGLVFFVLVFFAALTSSVSVMEVIVASMIDKFRITRKSSCAISFLIVGIFGMFITLGNGIWSHIRVAGMNLMEFFDYISNSVLMPVVALLTCIMMGWFAQNRLVIDEATRNGEKFSRVIIYNIMIKYIAPVMLIVIMLFYSLAQFGIIKI